MNTKIKKEELLKVLRDNREKHTATFEEAWKGYQQAVIKELEQSLEDARKGVIQFRAARLTQPINQVKDYNRIIRMIEMTTEEDIELEELEFSQYVLDQWRWAKNFAAANRSYTISDSSKRYLDNLDNAE